jgi:mannosyl-3-phosphoglycerate phosphatase
MDGAGGRYRVLVVTDLDGTLLDDGHYGYDAARPALEALRARDARLVIATSKTRAEVGPLAAGLGLPAASVVENGGAVVVPAGFFAGDAPAARGPDAVIELGTARRALLEALAGISRETGIALRGFHEMEVEEIARLTGLAADAAARAAEREYDEPFVLDDPAHLPAVAAAAQGRGLRVTRGGRFHHLTGTTDKGRGLSVVLGALERRGDRPFTIGLGDAPNDLPFLRLVDRPVIVPRPGSQPDADLAQALPGALRAPAPGPVGWNAAVLALLAEQDEREPGAGPRLPP